MICEYWNKIHNKWNILVFLFLFTLALGCTKGCASNSKTTPLNPIDIQVSVNASQNNEGNLEPIFSTGIYLNEIPDNAVLNKFFAEQRVGYFEVIIPFEIINRTLTDPAQGMTDLGNNSVMNVINKVCTNQGTVIVNLNPAPTTDPAQLEIWVKTLAAYLKNNGGCGNSPFYYVMRDEPDLFWEEDQTSYFEMYRRVAGALKQGDSGAKVGGVSTSNVDGKCCKNNNYSNLNPMLEDFITYAKENSAPVDFIIWHRFYPNPYGNDFKNDVTVIKSWLKIANLPETLELVLGSWNSWKEFGQHPIIPGISGEFSSERDTEYLAAYLLPTLMAMADAGITNHLFFTLTENWMSPKSEFSGGFGLFTKGKVIKPAYNAFRMIGMVKGNKIQTTSSDPYLSVLATDSNNTFFILLSSYLPENGRDDWVKGVILANPVYLDAISTISLDYLSTLMQESGKFSDPEITALVSAIRNEDENTLAQMLAGFNTDQQTALTTIQSTVSTDVNAFFFKGQDHPKIVVSDGLQALVTEIRGKVTQFQQEYYNRQNAPAHVNLSISGPQISGDYTTQTYQVGPNLANSYSIRSRVASALSRGQTGEQINLWPEIQLSTILGSAAAQNNLLQLTVDMSPYSSTLIAVSPY